ncbi:hypothetical protein FLL45_20915 [Aliikangiella marina]|uniref:Uncharacterized protein n=1 Tax=Aliikangiella marina TaxID=1712262 RepID=A0A545T315_9GAMM|nr:hypothetical protein [Aliikangiella marina]TQV71614.1 hypothetical protein FLL45_20915 [Aliikangiella marina]
MYYKMFNITIKSILTLLFVNFNNPILAYEICSAKFENLLRNEEFSTYYDEISKNSEQNIDVKVTGKGSGGSSKNNAFNKVNFIHTARSVLDVAGLKAVLDSCTGDEPGLSYHGYDTRKDLFVFFKFNRKYEGQKPLKLFLKKAVTENLQCQFDNLKDSKFYNSYTTIPCKRLNTLPYRFSLPTNYFSIEASPDKGAYHEVVNINNGNKTLDSRRAKCPGNMVVRMCEANLVGNSGNLGSQCGVDIGFNYCGVKSNVVVGNGQKCQMIARCTNVFRNKIN